ncbi:MAG: type II toxin-antitoxin system VapC family toxin [Acidobacteria bacterium]|nr:type II toxin-antitoxin system VapC family toxin [Acidobacteriota bacterium]
MSHYLLDTNVISEFAKPLPNPNIVAWLRSLPPHSLYASVITLGELWLGVENLPSGKRRLELEHWMTAGLPAWFADNLLPVTHPIARRWAAIAADARKAGLTLTTADGLIAATAIEHDLTLVTRNEKDFRGLSLTILNPWQAGT